MRKGDVLEVTDMQLESGVRDATASEKPPTLNLDALEKEAVATALHKHDFNISRAANELGLSRTALYRRMEKYDL